MTQRKEKSDEHDESNQSQDGQRKKEVINSPDQTARKASQASPRQNPEKERKKERGN